MFGIFKNMFSFTANKQLKVAIDNGAFLVDVRSYAEFSAGSVNGAVNIPLDKIQNKLNQFRDQKNIVVFCRSGNRSGQAKSILEQNGFSNVTNGGSYNDVNQILNQFK